MIKNTPHKNNKPWRILLILLLIFAVPLLLAWFFSSENDQLGQGTTNHGQLIQPPLNLSQLQLSDAQSQPITANAWKGRWLLLYANPGVCDAGCGKIIYYLRQIRTATGKDSERVQRAILSFSYPNQDLQLTKLLNTAFPGTLNWYTTSPQFRQFIHNTPNENLALTQGAIYLVDPLGNVLMTYQRTTDPMGIYKDLMRLLKVSHIG
jgi:cytochrome oxidase Cu insertion factor (SCO1/SenC/PrrC family)